MESINLSVEEAKMQDETIEGTGTTRRDFLKVATAVAGVAAMASEAAAAKPAAPAMKAAGGVPVPVADTKTMKGGMFPKGTVMAKGRVVGANDRVNVAFVGVGGMGGGHVYHFTRDYKDRNIVIGGVCDVFQFRREGAAARVKEAGAGSPSGVLSEKDYRKIIDSKDVDAVLIATPEHWHAQVACQAMEAGKHVYIQKPMTRYIDEAFQVHDTAKRTGRVVQVGSQGCSDYRFHTAAKVIKEGKIGNLVLGQGSYMRCNPKGEWNYGIDGRSTPENLDWNLWLGSAPARPWANPGGAGGDEQPMRDDAAARFHRYRKYSDYSAGILGDLMPHKLHPFILATGNPEYPTKVTCIGTQYGKDREVADTVQVSAEFPSGWSMLFLGSTINEQGVQDVIRGTKGSVYFGNGVEIRPERPYAEEIEGGNVTLIGPAGEPHERHENNWLEAIRANDPMKANCNYDLATKVQTIISLAEMSERMNKAMLFDPKTRKITAA